MVKIFDHLKKLKFSKVVPTAFTERTGDLLAEVVGHNLSTRSKETEIELNFAVVRIKHKIIRNEI